MLTSSVGAGEGPGAVVPAIDDDATPVVRGEGDAEVDRRLLGAVDQPQFGHAGLHQRGDDGARGAARAQDDDGPGVGPPAGRTVGQGLQEAEAVGVAAFERSAGQLHDRVHGADAGRLQHDAIEQRHDLDLVRQGEVAAARVGRAPQERHEFLERLAPRFDRQAAVVAIDAMLLQPEAVQRRRPRMLDRPADNGREGPAGGFGHQVVVGAHGEASRPMP